MKKLLFAIVVLVIFPLTVFSWTDTTGSTDTATVDYDTKDMLNNSYDRGTGTFKVELTSASPASFPSDYPDSAAQGSLSDIDTNTSNIYNQMKSSSIVVNQAYVNKVSTGTAGKLIISGNITITALSIDAYSFYSVGGDSQITSTWMDGTIYALEGIPIDFKKMVIPVANPTFQCSLATNTTLYYILNGIR